MSLTSREVRAPQFVARMTPHEVRAPQLGRVWPARTSTWGAYDSLRSARTSTPNPQFIGEPRPTACELRAPQFRVRMAAFEVRAPQRQAHNSLGACA